MKITDFNFTVFPSFRYADDEKRLLSGLDYDGASNFMIDRRRLLSLRQEPGCALDRTGASALADVSIARASGKPPVAEGWLCVCVGCGGVLPVPRPTGGSGDVGPSARRLALRCRLGSR